MASDPGVPPAGTRRPLSGGNVARLSMLFEEKAEAAGGGGGPSRAASTGSVAARRYGSGLDRTASTSARSELSRAPSVSSGLRSSGVDFGGDAPAKPRRPPPRPPPKPESLRTNDGARDSSHFSHDAANGGPADGGSNIVDHIAKLNLAPLVPPSMASSATSLPPSLPASAPSAPYAARPVSELYPGEAYPGEGHDGEPYPGETAYGRDPSFGSATSEPPSRTPVDRYGSMDSRGSDYGYIVPGDEPGRGAPPPVAAQQAAQTLVPSSLLPQRTSSLSTQPSFASGTAESTAADSRGSSSASLLPPEGDDPSANGPKDSAKLRKKRIHILEEIRNTERTFYSDMLVLDELFARPARSGALTPPDARALFSQLDAVIAASRSVLDILDTSYEADSPDAVLEAFVGGDGARAAAIEAAYAGYCKRQESALLRFAEIMDPTGKDRDPKVPRDEEYEARAREWIAHQSSQLAGRTAAWDLLSLLIKPVQRILRVPLLLSALAKATPADPRVPAAVALYEATAGRINELKRRKEVTEKVARAEGGRSVVHWTSKSLQRTAQQLRQATGLADGTVDQGYEALRAAFEAREAHARTMLKDAGAWTGALKAAAEALEVFAGSAADWYALCGEKGTWPEELARAAKAEAATRWREAERAVAAEVVPALERLLEWFARPTVVMRKREKKRLDYDRAKELKAKGAPVDEALEKSAAAYVALNAQLVEELPKFILLACRWMDRVAVLLASAKANALRGWAAALAAASPGPADSFDGIRARWEESFRRVEALFEGLETAREWKARTFAPDGLKGPDASKGALRWLFGSKSGSGKRNISGGDGGRSESLPSIAAGRSASVSSVVGSSASVASTPTETPVTTDGGPFDAVCVFPHEGPELVLRAGDVVRVEFVDDGGWWWVVGRDGKAGWVEVHHLERL
ncbi:hypothetical protein DFJ74DRAFT_743501 [Hyaloraphidium curvatum]|nr:hypothetical protein DFJ74DRAFT_743501 [Hyaloraphidium curvatum]